MEASNVCRAFFLPLFSYLCIYSELIWEELTQDDVGRIANFDIISERWSREETIWKDINELCNRKMTVHQLISSLVEITNQ